MANVETDHDIGEETDQSDEIQAIGNFESSNERRRHLRLKNDFSRNFLMSS